MVLLKMVPLFLGVHLLHLVAQGYILLPYDLESIVEPLESLQHRHAPLLPKHTRNLRLIRPILLFLRLMIPIELAMQVVAHCHGWLLMVKLLI